MALTVYGRAPDFPGNPSPTRREPPGLGRHVAVRREVSNDPAGGVIDRSKEAIDRFKEAIDRSKEAIDRFGGAVSKFWLR